MAPAHAQDRGTYLGFGLGQSRLQADHAVIDAGVVRSGFASASTSFDERDSAWKLYLGYQFNRNFAFEAGYTDFGKFSLSTATTGPAANVGGNIRAYAWSLDAVGLAPVSTRFTLFGKLGLQRWDTEAPVAAANAGAASSATLGARGNDWKLGVGARYDLSRNVGVRFEWERFVNVGDSAASGRGNIDLIAIGLQYRF
jgi:OOP family OmpA-OmpF porin